MDFTPDKPIAFNRDFVCLGIGITGALFLSQAIYWSKRTKDEHGWFYKTQEEWEEETGMTRYEQETARKKLKSIKVLEEKKAGVPARIFYRVNDEKLHEILLATKNAEMSQSSLGKSLKQEWGNTPNIHTENTAETTPKITEGGASEKSKAPSPPKPEQSKSYLEDLPDLEKLEQKYEVPREYIRDAAEKAKNWLEANGRKKKNYRSFLGNWILKDKQENPQIIDKYRKSVEDDGPLILKGGKQLN